MSRSLKKGPFVDEKLLKKIKQQFQFGSKEPIKTWSRSCVITPEMVNSRVSVHNGKNFIPIFITELMVGHKLGEFAPTRTFRGHSRKGMAKGERRKEKT